MDGLGLGGRVHIKSTGRRMALPRCDRRSYEGRARTLDGLGSGGYVRRGSLDGLGCEGICTEALIGWSRIGGPCAHEVHREPNGIAPV